MTSKAIVVTFISTAVVVLLVGLLSFWMWKNQPSADVASPPVPSEPTRPGTSTAEHPPVPAEPRIAGDSVDDGIVDALDINAIIIHFGDTGTDYKVTNNANLGTADIVQVFGNWKCYEGRADKSCPYFNRS